MLFSRELKTTEHVLRVACPPEKMLFSVTDEGQFNGFAPILMDEIIHYADLPYEIYFDNQVDFFERLRNNQIDMVIGAEKTASLEKEFYFNNTPLGHENSILYAKKQSQSFFYGDKENLNGARIGILNDYRSQEIITQFKKKNHIDLEIFTYTSKNELFSALNSFKIDLVLWSSITILSDYKLIVTLEEQPFFLIMQKNQKNKALIDKINIALESLTKIDPNYLTSLTNHYYGEKNSLITEFTRQEVEFMRKYTIPISIFVNAENFPFSYRHSNTGAFLGLYKNIFSQISHISRLKFSYTLSFDFLNDIEKGKTHEAVCIGPLPQSKQGKKYNYTHPLFTESYILVTHEKKLKKMADETSRNKTTLLQVAISKQSGLSREYIAEKYPNWQVHYFNNVLDCIQAVVNGDTDLAYINYFFINVMYKLQEYGKLSVLPVMDNIDFYFAVDKQNANPLLLSILNKAIGQITKEDLSYYVAQLGSTAGYHPNIKTVLIHYFPFFILSLLVIFAGFLIVFYSVDKKYKLAANIDNLTGVWTKWKFINEAQRLIRGNFQKKYALFLIEINRFYFLQKTFGSYIANQIIKYLIKSLSNLEIYNLLGKESEGTFLLLVNFNMQAEVNQLAQKICNFFDDFSQDSFTTNKNLPKLRVILKIGISFAGKGYGFSSVDDLIEKAQRAKSFTQNTLKKYMVFDEVLKKVFDLEYEIEKNMGLALEQKEFQVYYQVKNSIKTGECIGAEALVRWLDPHKRMVTPDYFIPIFEKNGFIIELDMYVYEEVFKFLRRRLDTHEKVVPISVNVSRLHVEIADFPERFAALADLYKIPPFLIEIEITETIFAEQNFLVKSMATKLRSFGFTISIDDFGSGYSSLNLLEIMPIQVLKLDRKFLQSIDRSNRSGIILEKVVQMAHSLGIDTLCEGVETSAQQLFLSSIDCDYGQGFFWGKPVSEEQFVDLLKA